MPRKLTYGVPLDTNITTGQLPLKFPIFYENLQLSNFLQQPTISHYYQRVESSSSLPQLTKDAF
jgi:hypothetical protein